MTTKTLDLNNIERKIFWALLTLLGIVSAFYLYSVLSLTLAVVDRNDTNRKVHELANSAGSLEAEYLAQTNSLSLSYAKTLGFYEVDAKFTGDNGAKLSFAR